LGATREYLRIEKVDSTRFRRVPLVGRTDAGDDSDVYETGFVLDELTLFAIERVEVLEVKSRKIEIHGACFALARG
jgi:hypothetical protein